VVSYELHFLVVLLQGKHNGIEMDLKFDVRMLTGFIWLRKLISDGSCEYGTEILVSIKNSNYILMKLFSPWGELILQPPT
jgi:hypothetical protein